MTGAVGAINLALGIVYVVIGVMTWTEMRRNRATYGFSHFGLAIVVLAFTCGPHHLHHGMHVVFSDRAGGSLDLVTTAVGVPVAATWVMLRLEAWSGGRGERFVEGTPPWVEAIPTVAGVYVVLVLTLVVAASDALSTFEPIVFPNLALVLVYAAIGTVLAKAQLANRGTTGGWSMSGMMLSGLFFTCALMHATHALYVGSGLYGADWHGRLVDSLSVPAGLYFLWVVHALSVGRLRDWDPGALPVHLVEADRADESGSDELRSPVGAASRSR